MGAIISITFSGYPSISGMTMAHFAFSIKQALKHLPREKPVGGEISIAFAFFSSFLASAAPSVISMFNVPEYGVKPSFCFICFLTHGSFMKFAPSPFPEKTRPLIIMFCDR